MLARGAGMKQLKRAVTSTLSRIPWNKVAMAMTLKYRRQSGETHARRERSRITSQRRD